MIRAAKKGESQVIRELLAAGVDCDETSIFGLTPLAWAVQKRHVEVAKLLCDAGANPNSFIGIKMPLLCSAVFQGHLEMAQILIEAGADVEASDCGTPPLFFAVDGEFTNLVRLLIEAGANPNSRNAFDLTPLHKATRRGSFGIVKLLLHAGANPNVFKGSYKETPLFNAAYNGNTDIAKLLIDAGAKFNDTPNFLSPLNVAITHHQQHTELVKVLIDGGADVNFAYSSGGNPLHTAAFERQLKVMTLLLDAGARLPSGEVHGERDGPNFSKEVQELLLSYPRIVTLRTLCLRTVRENRIDPQFLPSLVFLQPNEVEEQQQHCKRKRDFEENNSNKKR